MTTTGGFDIVAQVRAPFAGDIFKTYFDAGSIPHQTDFALPATLGFPNDVRAHLTLREPLLWIDTDRPDEVELIVSAHVTITQLQGGLGHGHVVTLLEFDAGITAFLTPDIQVLGGVTSGVVSLDEVDPTITLPTNVPNAPIIESLLAITIQAWLAAQSPLVVVLPTIPNDFHAAEVVVMDDEAETGRTSLALCLSLKLSGNSSDVSLFILNSEDFAIALSAGLVESELAGAVGRLPQNLGNGITLDNLSLSLIEGGFQVSGKVTYDPGECLPNIDISFSGPIAVSLSPSGEVTVDSHITIDDSIWFYILGALLGGLPTLIAEVVRKVVSDSLNAAVNTFGTLLSGQNIFNTTLPQLGNGAVISLSTAIRRLTIHSDALILGGGGRLSF